MSSLLSSLARVARGVVGTAAVGYLSAIFIADNVCHLTRLRGPSMLPTFEPGDRVLCVVPGARDIKLGDIVIAKNPDTLDTLMCKRVVAIAGDTLQQPSTSVVGPLRETVRVPAGHVWLAGDNPAQSHDSRQFGPVPIAMVESRVVAIAWPPARAGEVPRLEDLARRI